MHDWKRELKCHAFCQRIKNNIEGYVEENRNYYKFITRVLNNL
jgi:hypothetical protein